jgi:hypothetical protein
VILGGLDNREARLWINRAAWKTNRPWVDGAIEGINGVARVFLPDHPPCYECTLGETDWAILDRRMSCNLLLHDPHPQGRVTTTPTISSIIAGVQVQEAVKLLHGLPNHTSYVVDYTENPNCLSHYVLDNILQLPQTSAALTLQQLHERACSDLAGDQVEIDFSRDVIEKLVCPTCHTETGCFVPVGAISFAEGHCPLDGSMRIVHTLSGFRGQPHLAKRSLADLGLPLFDIFTARSPSAEISYCIAGDASTVLGPLAQPVEVTL